MHYCLNKIVWFFANPVILPLMVAAVGAVLALASKVGSKRVLGGWMLGLALAFMWFESTVTAVCLLGLPLERPYLATQAVEKLPTADAIVLLGGGIGKCADMVYPDMFEGADRIWHAARLWRAKKAPLVVVSGSNDRNAAVPLLLDLGVPMEAIMVDDKSRNTYENSRFTEALLKQAKGAEVAPSVLLVTSAHHMTRALGNFSRTSLKVTPAACDFSINNAYRMACHWWDWIAPSADSMAKFSYLFHEWLGKFARK